MIAAFFNRVFNRAGASSPSRGHAQAEMQIARQTLTSVYERNAQHFYASHPEAVSLAMSQILDVPRRDVTALFMVGIAMEAIEKLPELPTPPYTRAFLHVLAYLASDGSSREDAQNRIANAKEQLESLDKVCAWIVSQGRAAANDEDATYLAQCFDAVRRHNLLNS